MRSDASSRGLLLRFQVDSQRIWIWISSVHCVTIFRGQGGEKGAETNRRSARVSFSSSVVWGSGERLVCNTSRALSPPLSRVLAEAG